MRATRFALGALPFALGAVLFALCFFFTANSASAQSKIFWNEQFFLPVTDTIYSANLDGTSRQKLFLLGNLGNVDGLAIDPSNQKIYSSDSTGYRILRANFDGTGVETVISSLGSSPGDLALDVAAEKMYWISEAPSNEILRANFDGTGLETLESLEAGKLCLALDLINAKMYWATVIAGSGKIRRTNLDGTGLVDITSGLGTVTSLALDLSAGKLYWVDQDAAEIHRANLDGTGAELLVTAASLPHSISLDVAGGKMYWSDLDDGNLFRADLDGSNVETLTSAMPTRPEFLSLFISGSASTFAGLPNTSLGSASMSLDLNNHLVISNLGTSGLDGVSFSLGQAQFGELDFGSVLALSPGAFVQASAIGSLNNVAGQTIGSIRFTGTAGGNTNVQFDLSAVSIGGPCMIVYNGATQVFLGVVPGNSVEVAGGLGPCLIPFQPQSALGGGANALATVFLRQKFPITIPGGPTVTGDRIVALAENISASVEYVSEISVIGANLSSFTLEAEAVGLFGSNLHEAAGNAHLTATSNQLTVSNLGSSLLDGVVIDLEEAGGVAPCFNVGLADLPLSGVNEQVHFEAAAIGAVDLLATGSGFDVNVDFSGIGSSMVEVRVFNAGVPVGTAIVPAGTVGTITPTPNPIVLTRTFVEAAGNQGPCALVGFRSPVSFAPVTSNQLSVNSGQFSVISGQLPVISGQSSVVSDDSPSSVSFWKNLPSHSEETSAQEGDASAREGPYRMTNTEDADANPSSVSFWKNLPRHSEETSEQEGGASSREGPYRMTIMGGVGANATMSTLVGDEFHFHAVNPTTIPNGVSSVELLMANVPEFTIINEASEAPSPRVLVSNGPITIDRSKHSASKGDLHSNATITFKKGNPTTFTGNLSAVSSITINKDNTIVGNATSGSSITVASGASITGTRTPNTDVASIPITATSFSAGGANITVPKSGTRTLTPGSYGNVILNNSAKLNLSSGEYRFVKLETGSSCFLNFEVSNGGVQVKVTTSLKFGSDVTVTITPGGEVNSSAIDFITLQSTQVLISKDGYVLGTLTAPNAEVYVGKNTSLRGEILANKITVDRDVIFWHHSSTGVLPPAKASVEEEVISDQSAVISYELEQNYPNPFNPSTTIRFALPEASEVSLRIYNLNGQLVREVVNSRFESGRHSVVWDGKDAGGRQVASGIYWYKLRANDFEQVRKMVLVR